MKIQQGSVAGTVRLAAVGDLLLMPPANSEAYPRSRKWIGADVAEVFRASDLVFGNLECTLALNRQWVPTEPRVITDAEWIRSVKEMGFDVVTLANNHAFDGLTEGFTAVRSLLAEMALPHFGAGLSLEEAISPSIVESNGLRIALIGAVDPSSGPTQFATGDAWGVPPLDIERLGSQIRQLRSTVHHVIVSIHWGEERFLLPSPGQLDQARRLVDAGASMILGHHPHVLQGMEVYRGAPIIYSLGNFLADCVYYANGDAIRWNRVERTGCLLLTELTNDSVRVVQQIPTYDDGREIHIDRSGFGDRQIRRINRAIEGGVSESRYRRERFRIKTLRPTIDHLHPSKLIHLRPRHFRNALRTMWKS